MFTLWLIGQFFSRLASLNIGLTFCYFDFCRQYNSLMNLLAFIYNHKQYCMVSVGLSAVSKLKIVFIAHPITNDVTKQVW